VKQTATEKKCIRQKKRKQSKTRKTNSCLCVLDNEILLKLAYKKRLNNEIVQANVELLVIHRRQCIHYDKYHL